MSVVQEPEVKWTPDQMVEVVLNEPDDFFEGTRNFDSYRSRITKGKENLSVLPYSSQAR